jgi:hypothetical protein
VPPQDTPLFFAVLDGQSPKDWTLFGKPFPDLMREAKDKAKPTAVGADLLKTFKIYIEPVLQSPEELLKEKHLDSLAGIIIDALPKQGGVVDLDEKLTTFRDHIRQISKATKANSDALHKRIGYEIWFISDRDTDKLAEYVRRARDAASMLQGSSVGHFFITTKDLLIDHAAHYLSNVYFKMDRGN